MSLPLFSSGAVKERSLFGGGGGSLVSVGVEGPHHWKAPSLVGGSLDFVEDGGPHQWNAPSNATDKVVQALSRKSRSVESCIPVSS